MKKGLGIIPARFESSRFPGKPLALIHGKPMIRRVYEAAQNANSLERIIVATDDGRIAEACRSFGASVVMTSPDHRSGTERAAEAAAAFDSPIVVNIQGDEPLLDGRDIDKLVQALQDEKTSMASLMIRVRDTQSIHDENRVKVVTDRDGYALYFSRAAIPFRAGDGFFQHIGIYAFQRGVLEAFARLDPSPLEISENLEQLRALENGFRIRMIETQTPSRGVDVPRDIAEIERILDAGEP